MQQNFLPSSSNQRLSELTLIRDILAQANTLADKHGLAALAIAMNHPYQPTSKLVWGRTGSRVALLEAIAQATERLIIVCPWLSRSSLDDDLLLRIRALLDQNCKVEIGWGYGQDIGNTILIQNGKWWINAGGNARTRYNALPALCELRKHYPDRLKLKLLGTHEKFWVCDRQFAFVGNHNVLSSNVLSLNTAYVNREVGIRTEEPEIVDALTLGFDGVIDLAHLSQPQVETA